MFVDLYFIPPSLYAVYLCFWTHFLSVFLSRRMDECVVGMTSKVLVSFNRGTYLLSHV
jgi:hypothetical protein